MAIELAEVASPNLKIVGGAGFLWQFYLNNGDKTGFAIFGQTFDYFYNNPY